mmetsp:Transcript_28582/g.94847  ORF Transcript_28582/g.94847 Transcript_28582/m.94847 type:complete len:236 (+) Transcript_28582:681-1388(+)
MGGEDQPTGEPGSSTVTSANTASGTDSGTAERIWELSRRPSGTTVANNASPTTDAGGAIESRRSANKTWMPASYFLRREEVHDVVRETKEWLNASISDLNATSKPANTDTPLSMRWQAASSSLAIRPSSTCAAPAARSPSSAAVEVDSSASAPPQSATREGAAASRPQIRSKQISSLPERRSATTVMLKSAFSTEARKGSTTATGSEQASDTGDQEAHGSSGGEPTISFFGVKEA